MLRELKGDSARAAILRILECAHKPLSSVEIEYRLRFDHGIYMSTNSIGSHLGIMRVGNQVKKVACATDLHRYARQTYPVMVHFWYKPGTLTPDEVRRFRYEKRLSLTERYPPNKKHYLKRPRTDDMRQMIEDLRQ